MGGIRAANPRQRAYRVVPIRLLRPPAEGYAARAAAFPDAISERATKHLKELIRLKRKGHRAAVVFVVQRSDCEYFRPADEIDPTYGRWLRRAVKAGVEPLPYVAKVTPKGIMMTKKLETRL